MMVSYTMLIKIPRSKKTVSTAIKENWRGLYQKNSQFTYPEATLVVSKNRRNK